MASKSESARSSARRNSSHPKSSRQQFSACGACRMRRVRCDLKDLQAANPSMTLPACSNCQERGLKCVDEFAEVKAVKLLRRGRRLQQVEAVYGKSADDEQRYIPVGAGVPQSSCIPKLRPEFLQSSFFQALLTQRPIIEYHEFSWRFFEANNGNPRALGSTGQLLCMVLAAWAASFGVNESGEPEPHLEPQATQIRKERANMMAREILQFIDVYGLLRKPTWDGVRVLLLVLPLTEDVQPPMERLAMYEAAINQVYTLCSLASVTSVNSGRGEYVDAAVRARIFWYAHVHEGITTGLRGGRLLLTDDDLLAFQATLPSMGGQALQTPGGFSFVYQFAKIPLRLSTICRKVHASLTGPKARQSDEIDAVRLHDAWNGLTSAWEGLEALRHSGVGDFLTPQEVERFIEGWQILIFECLNVIREVLKQRLVGCSNSVDGSLVANGSTCRSPRFSQISQLHAVAESRCRQYARLVIAIVRKHIGTSFFEYDASLVRDGCFFAGVLLAGDSGTDEEVNICLQALRDMRWAFSKSEEREHTLRMVWEQRMASDGLRREDGELRRSDFFQSSGPSPFTSSSSTPSENHMRHPPPPLLITHASHALHDSAPNTAVTEDGWTMISNVSSYGTHSHRSASGSPPFVTAPQKAEAVEPAIMLAPHVNEPIFYPQTTADMDTFAYSIVPNTSGSPPRSPHVFTPPRSSAGMSSSSVTYSDGNNAYFDSNGTPLFTVSPPGSARGTIDGNSNGSLPSDKGEPYHVNYNTQFYVTP